MKKLKCTSCGGDMSVDEKNEYAVCKYCNTKYKLNEDINVNINVDEDLKNAISSGISSVGKSAKFIFIPIIIFAVIGMIIFLTTFISNRKHIDDFSDTVKENMDENIEENVNEMISSAEIGSYNNAIEMYSGTESKFFVDSLLDKIVTSNKKNADRLITVVYGEYSTSDPYEIVNLKHSLEDGDYEVSLDYDKDGFINRVTLQKL